MVDLIMHRGQVEADAARASADNWGGALQQAAAQIGQGLQQSAAISEQEKHSEAISKLFSGEAPPPPQEIIRVFGPEKGIDVIKGLSAISPKLPADAYKDRMERVRDAARGVAALPPEQQQAGWGIAVRGLVNAKVVTPEEVPEFSPEMVTQFANYGEKPKEKKGPISVAPGSALVDPETGKPVYEAPAAPKSPVSVSPGGTLVDPTTGKVVYNAPAAPKDPKLVQVDTVGADGKPVTKFVEPSAGASFPRADKPVPQQRLTKEERQDFAAWNYALPRLEQFAAHVKANPDKWGKWDAMVEGAKQVFPGLADAEYANEEAFIARLNAEVRHALFGASLTEGEQESARAFLIDRRDQPEVIMSKLSEAASRARGSMKYYQDLGFNIPDVPAAGPATGGAPANPFRAGADKQKKSGKANPF